MIKKSDDPLFALLKMRKAITNARHVTEGYGYDDFNRRIRALDVEAFTLFTEFDHTYSAPDPE